MRRSITAFAAGLAMAVTVLSTAYANNDDNHGGGSATSTPIKHLVVIFQENVSFDHYFGTYPHVTNPSGEPRFEAKPGTPSVNGLSGTLISNNPNATNPANGVGATNPYHGLLRRQHRDRILELRAALRDERQFRIGAASMPFNT